MLLRVPRFLSKGSVNHRAILSLASAQSIASFVSSIVYLYLPVFLTQQFNESVAGIIMGVGALITCIFLPVAGEMANRIGALRTYRFSLIIFIIVGLLWLFFPNSHRALGVAGFLYFAAYSFRIFHAYILKMAPKLDGGLLFGLFESIMAIGVFFGTLFYPYLLGHSVYILLLFTGGIALVLISSFFVPEDQSVTGGPSSINYITLIKKGMNFIQKNNYYPIFDISTKLFEGIFYSAIRFLFPLALIQGEGSALLEGLSLGIYELITISLGGVCGYLADKKGWKTANYTGWVLIIVGLLGITIWYGIMGLILCGAIIAIGKNLIFGAGAHLLEEENFDHAEDGSYIGLSRLALNTGYIIMPMIVGSLYAFSGFRSTLIAIAITLVLLGICMIITTYRK